MSTSSSTKKLSRFVLACGLLAAVGFMCGSEALAQTPPPGAIFDLATVRATPLTTYTQFTTSFVSAVPNTTISFAFREVPAFFAFDDAVVTTGGGANLLTNGNF